MIEDVIVHCFRIAAGVPESAPLDLRRKNSSAAHQLVWGCISALRRHFNPTGYFSTELNFTAEIASFYGIWAGTMTLTGRKQHCQNSMLIIS